MNGTVNTGRGRDMTGIFSHLQQSSLQSLHSFRGGSTIEEIDNLVFKFCAVAAYISVDCSSTIE